MFCFVGLLSIYDHNVYVHIRTCSVHRHLSMPARWTGVHMYVVHAHVRVRVHACIWMKLVLIIISRVMLNCVWYSTE